MPIYQFYCGHCEKDVELLMGMNESPVCPLCGREDLTKKLTAFALGGPSVRDHSAMLPSSSPAAAATGHQCHAGCRHGARSASSDCSVESTNKLIERHLGK